MSVNTLRIASTFGIVALALGVSTAYAGTKLVNGVEIRDWRAIDADKDNAISPTEMERFLQSSWSKTSSK